MPKFRLFLFTGIFWSVELYAQVIPFAFWQTPPAAGPVCYSLASSWTPSWASITGYWGLDGTVGAISNGTTITATVGGNGTASTGGSGFDYVTTKVNQGVQISTNSGVNLGHQAAIKTSLPISISMWVKIDTLAITHIFQTDSWLSGTGGNLCGAGLSTNGSGNVAIAIGNCAGGSITTNRRALTGTTALSTGVWYHLVGVIQGVSDMQLYINGVLESGATYGGNSSLSGIVYTGSAAGGIGYNPLDSARYLRGTIDEVAIWNAALSQADAETIYDNQVCP